MDNPFFQGSDLRHFRFNDWLARRERKTAIKFPVITLTGLMLATASFFSTSYVREGVNDKARRPVIFAFNGGPGASSAYLRMGAPGPKRVVFPADLNAEIAPPYKLPLLVDNNYALLDVADLVLIDPVETGYSRRAPGAKRESFLLPRQQPCDLQRTLPGSALPRMVKE
ncbi:MAG TPA: hypothetical protein VJ810_20570 [Blastocatellia bacterium]|nr:hypothetical protein [Blastocatellia bacterium]